MPRAGGVSVPGYGKQARDKLKTKMVKEKPVPKKKKKSKGKPLNAAERKKKYGKPLKLKKINMRKKLDEMLSSR